MVDVFSAGVGVRRGGGDGKECGGYQSEEDFMGGLHFFEVLYSMDLVSATLIGAGSLICLTWIRSWLFNWMRRFADATPNLSGKYRKARQSLWRPPMQSKLKTTLRHSGGKAEAILVCARFLSVCVATQAAWNLIPGATP